ncbi:adenylate cyclase [Geminocystis sp. NIES-3708]|uniref:CHASE2 domain-containing serine/threonine-protein kinase n=1 Tax=Geminocystis sp. NIES-3708 TaxID=1615909 RepID=UPI0005FC5626|nr:CHASE2 domain-containing serine/threonine-protein kinase [Geminocystis sp. NIES-3708]BAQ59648.1 adenylate cyclase [Geminocystis sp. NIES-3708]
MLQDLRQWLNKNSWRKSAFSLLMVSFLAGSLTVALKQWGSFEPFSLKFYDWLVQLSSKTPPDSRLLTVLITEEDIQNEGKWPISDETLAIALEILLKSNPHAIGIDLYRDLPVSPGSEKLSSLFAQSDRLSVVCKLESKTQPAVAPPLSLPIELVGFADIVVDRDGIVRRNLFYVEPTKSRCPTPYSLALQLTLNYLLAEGIEPEITEEGWLKLGEAILKPIEKNMGAYQNIDASGYQIILDYRRGNNPTPTVTLQDVLQKKVSPELIKNKIVLLGVSAPSLKDVFYTPFSSQNDDLALMPGITVHAHMTSQMLSVALDGQPLIWSWGEGGEIAWVYLWALMGGISILFIPRPLIMITGQIIGVIIIVGGGIIIFFSGGWIPIVPPLFAFFLGVTAMVSYNAYQAKQEQIIVQKQVAEQEKSIAMLQMLLETQSQISTPSIISYEPGVIIVSRYEIIKALGKGSFGSTYLSRDLQLPGKPYCVIKRLTPSSQEPKYLAIVQRLFKTEAKILNQVGKHPYIPQLLAYIEENDEFFLIQEYVEGKTLLQELRKKKKYSEKEVLTLIEKIMSILSFIEEYNLIHRDIKPDNIIRRQSDNAVILIDFGAVKQISRNINHKNKTVIIGNEGYAAPEQLAGHPVMASDIYATGMLAIHCLTGTIPARLPKDPQTGEVVWDSQEYASRGTASIIKKMTRYHFGDRYQNAQEVIKDLQKFKMKIKELKENKPNFE